MNFSELANSTALVFGSPQTALPGGPLRGIGVSGRPARDFGTGRRCVECGGALGRYNAGPWCYPCEPEGGFDLRGGPRRDVRVRTTSTTVEVAPLRIVRRRRFSASETEQVCRMYSAGASLSEIELLLGRSKGSLRRVLMREGVRMRPRGGPRVRKDAA